MSESSGEDTIADAHRAALKTLREKAMAWIETLGPGADGAARNEIPQGAIAKNDGLIDAFNIAAQIALRVIEKEREAHGLAAASDLSQLMDGQELDRLLAEELDRIASAGGPVAFAQADQAQFEAEQRAALDMAGLERAA
ncbi:MAG TPA: hypothetical protein VKZ79_03475 [Alphaproteobacteria bacterium]|nr:hypothetical protein [Alphaproteobacteria bacterium]